MDGGQEVPVNKIVLLLAATVLGAAGGGSGAFAVATWLVPQAGPAKVSAPTADPAAKAVTLPEFTVNAPLVFADGRLAGYATFKVQLTVGEDRQQDVTDNMPMLLNGINMRTYQRPMARLPDGLIPDLAILRAVIREAASEAFGKDAVRDVLITEALPHV